MAVKQLKQKKCKHCRDLFTPFNSMTKVCSPTCALALVRNGKQKEFNRVTREKKQAIKSRGDWLKEAQVEFNKFIRLRDAKLPCVSCGSMPNDNNLMTGSRWDCGHYKSRGSAPELRFEELNCAKQCVKCNRDLSGNIVNYRIELIARIGEDKLAWLEGPHSPKKYTIDEIKAIKAKYNALYRELRGNE